ncbi:hypothetical protein BHYA_0007g00540 [Botrytis hyacinthi]|uniref:Uncharacterized protein n=1 Tax=Botrytis hyacinthi TaxID=278943 RepID=A0A4Z1GZZ4_9HELO|nr:hypothetical protein BHYA_0007g00540 [Botrytis hyacinthi]
MGLFGNKDDGKKARNISGPLDVKASTTLREGSSYTRDTKDPTQQPPRIPDASLNDTGHSSTPDPSTIHGHPNRAPQDPSRSAPNNPLQSNHAPHRLARPQQLAMNASMAGQSSTTGRLRSQDHTSLTQRNSGNHNSSRPSSSHSRPSSSHSRPSSSHFRPSSSHSRPSSSHSKPSSSHSRASSLDRDPFEYDSPEYRKYLKKG